MPILPLVLVEKWVILEAIVDCDYNLVTAARELGIGRNTIYRKVRRWNLVPPMFSPVNGGTVLRKDFLERCSAIQEALREVNSQMEEWPVGRVVR